MRIPTRTLFLLLLLCSAAPTRVLHRQQSPYSNIIVREDANGIRTMHFKENGLAQTAVDSRNPQRLVAPYARTTMLGLAIVSKPQRILIVGLGGGSMPMFLRRNCPDSIIDIVELDPDVPDIAKRFFFFREDPNMKVHVADGRAFIEKPADRYDIIFLDAYSADDLPYALATREFLLATRSRLTDHGLVVANVWGPTTNKLYPSMIKTYRDVFPELHIIRAPASDNHIFLAFPAPANLTKQRLAQLAADLQPRLRPSVPLESIVTTGYEPSRRLPTDAKVLLDADRP